MKVVILAGGFGTRLSEETHLKPKPMVEIGGKPILWHIMKVYSTFGFNEFVILLGYKGYHIKEYFANYFLHESDVTIDISSNDMQIHKTSSEPWKITLLDTGMHTMTGGRIKRARIFLGDDSFMLTYGDGVADIDIKKLLDFHKGCGKTCTITTVQPQGRFGSLEIGGDHIVRAFEEKPRGDGMWINGGFFVCEPGVFEYISGDDISFERQPLENLANDNQLVAFRHRGFWQCMDTLRDMKKLNDLWTDGSAPWKIW